MIYADTFHRIAELSGPVHSGTGTGSAVAIVRPSIHPYVVVNPGNEDKDVRSLQYAFWMIRYCTVSDDSFRAGGRGLVRSNRHARTSSRFSSHYWIGII